MLLLHIPPSVHQGLKTTCYSLGKSYITKRCVHKSPTYFNQMDASKPVDHYELLGVSKTDTKKQIKKAYLQKAKVCHPDVSSDPDSIQKFQDLTAAHAILSNRARRKQYDLELINPTETFKKQFKIWVIVWPLVFLTVTAYIAAKSVIVFKPKKDLENGCS